MWTGTHTEDSGSGGEAAGAWMEREEFAGLFITWLLVGRARDGAALGWTDASPKRNHRISSTQEERRGQGEGEKGVESGRQEQEEAEAGSKRRDGVGWGRTAGGRRRFVCSGKVQEGQ